MNGKMKNFAVNMKKKREELKITQRDLASGIGITAATISAYEKQTKSPSLENAIAICDSLGCTLDEMCGVVKENTEDKKFENYSEAFKSLIKVVEELRGKIYYVNYHDGQKHQEEYGIVFENFNVENFINDWAKIKDLYESKTIDKELYIAWQEKKFREYLYQLYDENDNPYDPEDGICIEQWQQ